MEVFDVIVIGAGPAGCAAAVYVSRKQLNALMITKDFGGQSQVSDNIENWIGDVSLSGFELAKRLEMHVKAQKNMLVKENELVSEVIETEGGCELHGKKFPCYQVKTDKNTYITKTVIVAAGGRRRKLNVPGEEKYDGRGIAYCSTCDAPLFKGKDVAVIGGGNAGIEAVIDLLAYANHVYLLERSNELKADSKTVKQMKEKGKDQLTILFNAQVKEVFGESFLIGLKYMENEKEHVLNVQGVFVEIGSIPNTECVKNLVETEKNGEIVVDHVTQKTSKKGIFAAGDVTNEPYKQNNISAGQGVSAALSAYNYLLDLEKSSPANEAIN